MIRTLEALTLACSLALAPATQAAQPAPAPAPAPQSLDPDLWSSLEWSELGPYRGGRAASSTGVQGHPRLAYMGATGGGVWKTSDGGASWSNISDGFFGGSIGAVSVAPSDPNVLYVGTGETTVRGNVSGGDGVWRSVDAGETWTRAGLEDSAHIGRIRIHPTDPDTAWVAALGHLFGPGGQRGVYKTTDGGSTWRRVLETAPAVGVADLELDPANPRVLFATTWRVQRSPWDLSSGGEGSGLHKSTDGGETWTDLSSAPGLPAPPLGIGGVSVGADPKRIYLILEAAEGGVFQSNNGGESWRRTNSERSLRQRAWYYSRITADPNAKDTVWVSNVRLWKSVDGGTTFDSVRTPHGDNHDLWIDPADSDHLVQANDGGANVSFDGGATWSRQDNQPTAQFYRVSTDNDVPFRVLGGQQDNSTVRLSVRGRRGGRPGMRDWAPTAGGESGHVVAHPENPDIVYGGSYGGTLTRIDHGTGEVRSVHVWPDNPMGWGTRELKYRFQWNFPLFFSPHKPHALYAAAQVLFRSTDDGASWQVISPDLTRNDKTKQESSGGPITKDNTSVEYHGTIFAAAESPLEQGLLWCGSDDGLLHVSRDDGASWSDVTPADMPKWAQINSIEVHPREAGGLYVAATSYRLDDNTPYLFATRDYGATWTRIDDGIPRHHFTRVVRADPDRDGLLYAGTERGMHLSFDDGQSWSPLQLNLPQVPITDLAVKRGRLVAATQGRGFWILRDLSPLHGFTGVPEDAPFALLPPRAASRAPGLPLRVHWIEGPMAEDQDSRSLEIRSAAGEVLRTFEGSELGSGPGLRTVSWDLRTEPIEDFDGMVLWNSNLAGAKVVPGDYTAVLRIGEWEASVPARVDANPKSSSSQADLEAQFEFLRSTGELLTSVHKALGELRGASAGIKSALERVPTEAEALRSRADDVLERMGTIERALYQTQNRSRQDPLNFPIRLNDKLAGLRGSVSLGDYAPTAQAVELRAVLEAQIAEQLNAWKTIASDDLPALDAAMRESAAPYFDLPESATETGTNPPPVD